MQVASVPSLRFAKTKDGRIVPFDGPPVLALLDGDGKPSRFGTSEQLARRLAKDLARGRIVEGSERSKRDAKPRSGIGTPTVSAKANPNSMRGMAQWNLKTPDTVTVSPAPRAQRPVDWRKRGGVYGTLR